MSREINGQTRWTPEQFGAFAAGTAESSDPTKTACPICKGTGLDWTMLRKEGVRNHHPQSEYIGKRVIDVSKLPSDDSWTYWHIFESEMPLPIDYDETFIHSLDYASWMDVDPDDCEFPGQLFRRRAYISKMGRWKMLITQGGGRDI